MFTACVSRFSTRFSTWLPGGDRVVSPLVYHATVSLRWGCGWAVTLLALPAMAYGLWRGGARGSFLAWAWLLVPVGLTLAFGLLSEPFSKFLLVAVPLSLAVTYAKTRSAR